MIFRYLNKKIVPAVYKKIPNNLVIFALFVLYIVFAPILAIKVVIGTNIKKAGIFIKPMLNGKFTFKFHPEIRKPIAANREIIEPIAAALPIALLIV